jgi:hypothetical protein
LRIIKFSHFGLTSVYVVSQPCDWQKSSIS